MPTVPIPYTVMTSREPPFLTEVLTLDETDAGVGFVLDRGVTDGANYKDPSFSYKFEVQQSPDGQNWLTSNGATNLGGISEIGSGTAEDPMFIFQYDSSCGSLSPGAKFVRAKITAENLPSAEQFGFSGILASNSDPQFQFGFPE